MKYSYKNSGFDWLGQIPDHWSVERLKAITSKVNSGVTPKGGATSYVQEGVPLIRSQNVMSGVIDFSDVVYISPEIHQAMCNSWVQQGDVLLNITGASLGRTASVTTPIEANVNQHVCIIRPTWKVRTDFLAYLLQCELAQAQIFSSFTGSGREGLGYAAIKQMQLPLPPTEEQAAIAAYLDNACAKLDRVIAIKEEQIAGLDALWHSRIQELLTNGRPELGADVSAGDIKQVELPDGWTVKRVKQIGHIKYGLGQPPKEKDDGLPIIRATNVKRGVIDEKDLVLIDPDDVPYSRDPVLKEGDIIVVRSGAYTADSAIIPKKYEGAITGYDMVLRCHPNVSDKFVAYSLLSKYVLDDQMLLFSLRAAQPHLNKEELGMTRVLLPGLDEQKGIVAKLERAQSDIALLKEKMTGQVKALKAYRKSLIHECVTGKKQVYGVGTKANKAAVA